MWQRVIEPLSESFQVVVVDLPGFGESDCPTNNFSTEEYASFLCRLLDHLNIQTLSIAGISYGGQIAATFASHYPERVEKLVLIASSGLAWGRIFFQNNLMWDIVAAVIKNTLLQSITLTCLLGRLSFYHIASRPYDLCSNYFRQLSSSGKREVLLHTIRNIYTGQNKFSSLLLSLQVSTLIIWGKQDRTLPVKFAYKIQRKITHSSLCLLSECAHSCRNLSCYYYIYWNPITKGNYMKGITLHTNDSMPEFNNLPGTDGKTYSSSDFKNKKLLVIVFSCNHCPYVQAYEDRIMAIQKDYSERGMTLIAINSNDTKNYPDDGFTHMVDRAQKKGFNFLYLRDDNQSVAESFGATHTPQFFLFDENRRLRYNGKMDDNWKEPQAVKETYLRDALDALLAGKDITIPETFSIGCTIKWR
jgi:pimeloyl-ACP methyl ester carboxylesterase/peroxiredoxin